MTEFHDVESPETAGVQEDITDLATGENVRLRRDITGKITAARRADVFDTLRSTKLKSGETVLSAAHMVALSRLQRDIAIRSQTVGASGSVPKIDNGGGKDRIDLQILAAQRLDFVESRCGQKSWELLSKILEPMVSRGEDVDWRAIVASVTGVTNEAAQPGQIRHAMDNLLGAFVVFDKMPPSRRSAA